MILKRLALVFNQGSYLIPRFERGQTFPGIPCDGANSPNPLTLLADTPQDYEYSRVKHACLLADEIYLSSGELRSTCRPRCALPSPPKQ